MQDIPRDFIQSNKEPFGLRAALAQLAVGLAAGVLAGLGQAPFSLVFLSLPGFAAAFWLIRRASTARGAMVLGWAVGAGYFAVSLFWIVEPFFVDAARHGWMAPFALIFMAGGMALFWGAAARLARWMAGEDASTLALAVAWVTALSLAEYARANILTGFPWAMPAYIWTDTGMAQLGAILGPHGLNFMTIAMGSALTGVAFAGRTPKLAALLGVIAPVAISAGLSLSVGPVRYGDDSPQLRIVQPNAPQKLKWKADWIEVFYRRAREMTAAPAEVRPDIVIWPETSLPRLLENAGFVLGRIAADAGGADVIVGAMRRDAEGTRNSLVLAGPDGAVRDLYDKHHLVPFGEYIPLVGRIADLGWSGLADRWGGGFVAGDGPKLMQAATGGAFLPLICYEAIFPGAMTPKGGGRADWLLQITNDAWFGDLAGPQQHLAQARMRAIEQGLPMVRAANTGISAVIGPRGQVVSSLPLGQAGYMDARLPAPLQPTLYALLGDLPILSLLILCAGATLFQRGRFSD